MSSQRRRHCPGCGKWMRCGDEKCLDCDPVCWGCDDRVSEVGELNQDDMCKGCLEHDAHELDRQPGKGET